MENKDGNNKFVNGIKTPDIADSGYRVNHLTDNTSSQTQRLGALETSMSNKSVKFLNRTATNFNFPHTQSQATVNNKFLLRDHSAFSQYGHFLQFDQQDEGPRRKFLSGFPTTQERRSSTKLNMNTALTEIKEAEHRQTSLKARINKLQKEEHEANLKIKQDRERVQFIQQMTQMRQQKAMMKDQVFEHHRKSEQKNRSIFTQSRSQNKFIIQKEKEQVFKLRHDIAKETKFESKIYNEKIRRNQEREYIRKQEIYKTAKQLKIHSKSQIQNRTIDQEIQNKNNYFMKINDKFRDANRIQTQSKFLIQQEKRTVENLSKTIARQQRETKRLRTLMPEIQTEYQVGRY